VMYLAPEGGLRSVVTAGLKSCATRFPTLPVKGAGEGGPPTDLNSFLTTKKCPSFEGLILQERGDDSDYYIEARSSRSRRRA